MKNMAQLRHSKHLKECLKKYGKKWDHNYYYEKTWKNDNHRNTWQNLRTLVNKEGAAKVVAHALKC